MNKRLMEMLQIIRHGTAAGRGPKRHEGGAGNIDQKAVVQGHSAKGPDTEVWGIQNRRVGTSIGAIAETHTFSAQIDRSEEVDLLTALRTENIVPSPGLVANWHRFEKPWLIDTKAQRDHEDFWQDHTIKMPNSSGTARASSPSVKPDRSDNTTK